MKTFRERLIWTIIGILCIAALVWAYSIDVPVPHPH
jgi:hypothetical protein